MAEASTKIAVVTGANKGIGFEICKQLASLPNFTVVLSSRDPTRGRQGVDKLKAFGVAHRVVFQQLDVADPASVASFAQFIESQFGKLDILVNNAGVAGAIMNNDAMKVASTIEDKSKINWSEIIVVTPETAESAFQINYYGVKRTTEALLPLLQLSDSPKIVNVSSSMGMLKNIPNEWAKGILSDIDNLTEEKLDEVVNEYLKDLKAGCATDKRWPQQTGSYSLSKAVVTAYTRLLARKHPSLKINVVCPGFTKTDINANTGVLTVEEGAESVVRLVLLPDGDDAPSGLFFVRKELSEF